MKRRTKRYIGQWPNMRDDTLAKVAKALIRSRQYNHSKDANLRRLEIVAACLRSDLSEHNSTGRITAAQVYARAAEVAAMAIRVLEEGTAGFAYMGNTAERPKFELVADDGLPVRADGKTWYTKEGVWR